MSGQLNIFDSLDTPTKFKVGDRVKYNLWDCYFGVITAIQRGNSNKYIIKGDDKGTTWAKESMLEQTNVKEFKLFGNLDDMFSTPTVAYPKLNKVLSPHKDVYTVKDISILEDETKSMERDGHTGHHFAINNYILNALRWLKEVQK